MLVDAVVTDKKGNYISDLTQQDFRVWEDDKEQQVKSFSFASSSTDLAEKPKYTVLLFDNSNVADADQKRVRGAAASFVEANAGPKNYIAILDFGRTVRVAQNFTTDAAHLKEVVLHDKFASASTSHDPVRVANMAGMPASFNAEGDFGVRALLLGIGSVAARLAAMPGRKSLILLSSGFTMGPQVQSDLKAATEACNKANVAIYPVALRGLTSDVTAEAYIPGRYDTSTYGPGHATSNTPPTRVSSVGNQAMIASITAADTSSHSGVGGPQSTSSNAASNQQVLEALASSTGGFVVVNAGDLLARMDKIAREQNEYYVLGYTPPVSPGACHDLRVKVERTGAFVRARSGYCTVRQADPLAGKPVGRQLEAWAGSASKGNIAASMRAPYFYTSPNVARVELAIEIPSGAVNFAKLKDKPTASIDILGLGYKADGTVAVRFSDTIPIELASDKDAEAFSKNPLHYTHEFEATPGSYNLTIVLTTGNQNFAKLEMPLVIDPYDGKKLAVSEIALSKEVYPASADADLLNTGFLENRTALVSHGFEFVPCGTEHFQKGGPAAFYVEIYEPLLLAPNPPQVEMQLKIVDSKTGAARVDASGGIPGVKAGNPVVPLGLKIPIETLAPGTYRLELKAMDSAGNATVQRTLSFQVD